MEMQLNMPRDAMNLEQLLNVDTEAGRGEH
jgi:hypothetical protein